MSGDFTPPPLFPLDDFTPLEKKRRGRPPKSVVLEKVRSPRTSPRKQTRAQILANRDERENERWEGFSSRTRSLPHFDAPRKKDLYEIELVCDMFAQLNDPAFYRYHIRRILRSTGIYADFIDENGNPFRYYGPLNRAQMCGELGNGEPMELDMREFWCYEKDYKTFKRNVENAYLAMVKRGEEEDAEEAESD